MLVDVHIEKTAGRSKRRVLLDSIGTGRVLHYDCSTDRLVPANKRLHVTENPSQEKMHALAEKKILFPFVKMGYQILKAVENKSGFRPEEIPSDFRAITGHLTGDRFAHILSPLEAKYTTVLREPLARTRSHFEHWRRTRGLARFRFCPEFKEDLRFEEFALLPELQNYQTVAMGIPANQFSTIGVVDNLDEYLEELELIAPAQTAPYINKATYPANTTYDKGFIRDFRQANQVDMELYVAIYEKWNPGYAPTV